MKNKFLLPVLFLSFFIVSCGWQVPEKVTVKAEPVYKFTAGTIEPPLGDDLNFKSIIKDMMDSGETTFGFYDYNPNGKATDQQFLIRMPIAEVPIDFNSFLENSGLNSAVRELSFEQTVTIPEINMNVEQEVEKNDLQKAVNVALTYINNNFISDFTKAEFISGKMKLTVLDELNIADGSYIQIVSNKITRDAYFYDNQALIDLSNFTIYKNDFSVYIDGISGFSCIATIEEYSEIKTIEGLTIKDPVTIPCEFEFSASDSSTEDSFEECTVKEGTLTTDVVIPETWSGVGITYTFSTTGALKLASQEKNIDLAGKSIKSGNTTANANIKATINNATIDFSNSLKINIQSDIKTLESIALVLPDFTSGIEISEPFGEEIINSIEEIDLLSSGLNITYTNTFPEDNDIAIVVNSDFIGMNNSIGTLESGKEQINKSVKIMSEILEDDPKIIKLRENPVANDEYSNYDFKVDIKLPGRTEENPNRINLKNVSFGDEYSLIMQIEPVINWKKVILSKELASSLSQKSTMELPLDLTGLFDSMADALGGETDFIKKIRFSSMPLYIFCTSPQVKDGEENPFEEAKFKGNINLHYGKINDGGTIDAITTKEVKTPTENEIGFVNDTRMTFDENDKSILTTDYSTCNFSAKAELSELLNVALEKSEEAKDCGLIVDYDLNFTNGEQNDTIEITNDMLTTGGTIGVYAVAILPLKFKASDTMELDLTNLAGDAFGKDLFNRNSANDMSNIKEYADYIRKVSIDYESEQLPLFGKMNLDFGIDYGYDEKTEKPIGSVTISGKYSTLQKGYIELESADLTDKLLAYYPAKPQISISINKDEEFGIPRDVGLAMKLSLTIEADIDIPVLGGK